MECTIFFVNSNLPVINIILCVKNSKPTYVFESMIEYF